MQYGCLVTELKPQVWQQGIFEQKQSQWVGWQCVSIRMGPHSGPVHSTASAPACNRQKEVFMEISINTFGGTSCW